MQSITPAITWHSRFIAALFSLAFLNCSIGQTIHPSNLDLPINVSLPEVGAANLKVEYPAIAACPFLTFADDRDVVHKELRSFWSKAPGSCGELTKIGVSTAGCDPGQRVTILVPNTLTVTNEPIYSTATPLAGFGTLVHTSAIVTRGECNESKIEFIPPKDGAITLAGLKFQSSVIRNFREDESIAGTYVFFGGAKYAAVRQRITFGADFPDAVREKLMAIIERVSSIYASNAPQFVAPHVFVGYHSQPPGFGTNFSGDVSLDKRMLNLSFFRDSPVPVTDVFRATLFVAHEFAHITQPNLWLSDDPNWAAAGEGNAEIIALLTMANLNSDWRPIVAEKIEGAINRCLIEVGPSVWRDSSRRIEHRIPYDCGLAFEVASLLAERSR